MCESSWRTYNVSFKVSNLSTAGSHSDLGVRLIGDTGKYTAWYTITDYFARNTWYTSNLITTVNVGIAHFIELITHSTDSLRLTDIIVDNLHVIKPWNDPYSMDCDKCTQAPIYGCLIEQISLSSGYMTQISYEHANCSHSFTVAPTIQTYTPTSKPAPTLLPTPIPSITKSVIITGGSDGNGGFLGFDKNYWIIIILSSLVLFCLCLCIVSILFYKYKIHVANLRYSRLKMSRKFDSILISGGKNKGQMRDTVKPLLELDSMGLNTYNHKAKNFNYNYNNSIIASKQTTSKVSNKKTITMFSAVSEGIDSCNYHCINKSNNNKNNNNIMADRYNEHNRDYHENREIGIRSMFDGLSRGDDGDDRDRYNYHDDYKAENINRLSTVIDDDNDNEYDSDEFYANKNQPRLINDTQMIYKNRIYQRNNINPATSQTTIWKTNSMLNLNNKNRKEKYKNDRNSKQSISLDI